MWISGISRLYTPLTESFSTLGSVETQRGWTLVLTLTFTASKGDDTCQIKNKKIPMNLKLLSMWPQIEASKVWFRWHWWTSRGLKCHLFFWTNRETQTNSTYGRQRQTYKKVEEKSQQHKLSPDPSPQCQQRGLRFFPPASVQGGQTNGLRQKNSTNRSASIREKRGRERRSRELVKGSETEANETSAPDPF